jgi:hypothetical protein
VILLRREIGSGSLRWLLEEMGVYDSFSIDALGAILQVFIKTDKGHKWILGLDNL